MRAETYAVVNLAALNLIEAMSAAYYATEAKAAARHAFRVREMLKRIAAALEQEPGHAIVEAARVGATIGEATGGEATAGEATGGEATVGEATAGAAKPAAPLPTARAASPCLTLVSDRSATPASLVEQ